MVPVSSLPPLHSHQILCPPPPLPYETGGKKEKHFPAVAEYSLLRNPPSVSLSQTFQLNFQDILQKKNPHHAPWCLCFLHCDGLNKWEVPGLSRMSLTARRGYQVGGKTLTSFKFDLSQHTRKLF